MVGDAVHGRLRHAMIHHGHGVTHQAGKRFCGAGDKGRRHLPRSGLVMVVGFLGWRGKACSP
ncbi:hypothetical protein D3C87_2068550 [compost metagenome]